VIETRFKQLPFTKLEARKFSRLFFSNAVELTVDQLGRILLPKALKTLAAIQADVVLIGVLNRVEIWAKEKWGELRESSGQSYEELAERVMLE
jgi:MraZ protein